MHLLNVLLNTNRREGADATQFGVLLGLMFVWLLAMPVAIAAGGGGEILRAAFALIATQALLITATSRREKWIFATWGLLFLVHPLISGPRSVELSAGGLIIALLLYVPMRLSAFVLEQEVVDRNTIFGALCAYLFMGTSFAVLFGVIVDLWPGAIAVPEGTPADFMSWLYFSFTTLTTLGYGDIAPRLAPVRMLAILEALIGQIYLVVVVARLVSSYMGSPRTRV